MRYRNVDVTSLWPEISETFKSLYDEDVKERLYWTSHVFIVIIIAILM
jgi:hypothetical protein